MKIQFALLSIILFSTLMVIIPDDVSAQTDGIILESVDSANICGTDLCSKNLFSVHFADPLNGWAVGNFETILYTGNGGKDWTKQFSSDVNVALKSVYFTDVNNGWAVGDSGTILYTSDKGKNWKQQEINVEALKNINLKSVHFADSLNGWAVGDSGTILYTSNGGKKWTEQISPVDVALESVYFVSPMNGSAVGDIKGRTAPIIYTDNGGVEWKTKSVKTDSIFAQSNVSLKSVYFTDVDNGWAVGDANNKALILHTTDGGISWDDQSKDIDLPMRTELQSVHIVGSNGFAVGYNLHTGDGIVLHTMDDGVSWSKLDVTSRQLHSVHVVDNNKAFAVGDYNSSQIHSISEPIASTSDTAAPIAPIASTSDTAAPAAPVITPPVTLTNENTITIAGTAENGSTVTLTRNSVALVPTATSDGTWSIDVTLIQDANTFTATATDQAGNISGVSNSVTVTLDTTAPVAPVITSPASPETSTNEYTHKITGTAENDSTITLTQNITVLESVTVGSNGIWSIDVTLGYGTNIFTATATDQAGNTSKDSTSIMVIFDDTPPAAPVIKSPTPSTSETAHTIDGTAVVGFPYVDSTVTLTQNGAPLKSVPIASDGTWSVSVTLREGENTFTATASDQAGNISDVSNSVTVTRDTPAPEPAPVTPPPAAPVITPPTTLTNENTITITGTTVEGSTVTLIQNNIALTPTTITSSDGIWSVDVTLIQGDNTFTATATDQAGNISDVSNSVTVTLDNTAPIITLTGANPQTIELGVDYTELGATTDDGSEVSIDSSAYRNVVGTYIITYTATDGTNQATATRTVNVVDTTAPVAPVITLQTTLTNENTITITGTTVEGSTVTLTQNDNVLTSTVTIDSDGIWSVDVTLIQGANTFTATATDQAGNISDVSNSVTVTRDTTAPVTPAPVTPAPVTPAPVTPAPDTTAPAAPIITSEATSTNKKPHTITGTAENGSTVTLRQNVTVLESVTVGSNGAWSVSVTLGAGTNTFTATATDQAGNTSKDSTPIMVIFDNLPPAAPIITSEATSTTETAHTITGTANVGYPNVDSTITLTQNGAPLKPVPIGSNDAWSVSVTLREGENTFTATASDQAGNISAISNSVVVTLNNVAPDEPVMGLTQPSMNSPPTDSYYIIPDKSASIKVFDGSQYVDFTDGMTINSGTPKFRGTSNGINSVKVMIGDSQVGGNKISSDGSFIKGWKGVNPLADGTYSLTVSDNNNPETILFTSYIIIDANNDKNPINAQITKVRVGTVYVNFEHGMTINPETLKFRGTSAGIDSVKVMIDGNQVGGNNIRDNGIFAKGWKGDPLTDGKYSLTVSDNGNPETILFTSYIIIQNPVN